VISGSTRNSDKPEMSSRTTEGQRIEVSAMDNLNVSDINRYRVNWSRRSVHRFRTLNPAPISRYPLNCGMNYICISALV
jgi:hypothetical protein